MRYAFVAAHASEYAVERMCQVLAVGRSGYYAWKQRAPSPRSQVNAVLVKQIRSEYHASRETYGSPRIQVVLARQGIVCGHNRVARLMHQAGLCARHKRRSHPLTTQRDPEAVPVPNRLNQEFAASAPNQKWVTDITYIPTAEGWLYLAVVLDLYSRLVVGWAMSDRIDTALVAAAWHMAMLNRQPEPGLLHHSDQGRQYTANTYLEGLKNAQMEMSMSRTGNCFDNAVMESFFSTLKFECVTSPFQTRKQARTAIFEYLEVWYNRQRLHSTLGYLSPAEFEHNSPFNCVH